MSYLPPTSARPFLCLLLLLLTRQSWRHIQSAQHRSWLHAPVPFASTLLLPIFISTSFDCCTRPSLPLPPPKAAPIIQIASLALRTLACS
eukprot:755677-Hanusia_phi.AAC.9